MKSIGNVLLYIAVIVILGILVQIPIVSGFFKSVIAVGDALKLVAGLFIVICICSLPVRLVLFLFRSICSFFKK